jgi:hypothetical protein
MAAIAGLAASRFLTASAHRRSGRSVSRPNSPSPSATSRSDEGAWNFEEDRHNG